jgi:hypothetical protein
MSREFSLLQVSHTDIEDINAFLIKWSDEYNPDLDPFILQGGSVEVLHFLLTASFDLEQTWFEDSKQLISEVSIPEYGDILLVNVLAGGTWLKTLSGSPGLVACYLTVNQVREVAKGLCRIAEEDLAARWDALNQIAKAERKRAIGRLTKLHSDFVSLQESVENIREFSDSFEDEFVAYFVDAAEKGFGVVVLDCT